MLSISSQPYLIVYPLFNIDGVNAEQLVYHIPVLLAFIGFFRKHMTAVKIRMLHRPIVAEEERISLDIKQKSRRCLIKSYELQLLYDKLKTAFL